MKIFLIGMMGSGKTYWLHQLASQLQLPAFDLDALIESAAGQTIATIFRERGESGFRQLEADILRRLPEKEAYIVATGGGTPCFHDNMNWMNAQGITIWLDEPLEKLVHRLQENSEHRPLIAEMDAGELPSFLASTLADRKRFYQQAAIHLYGDAINRDNIIEHIKQRSNA